MEFKNPVIDSFANKDDLPQCKTGTLPANALLAVPFVPFQRNNPPVYSNEDALVRGTLFPGLDLPFMNAVNKSNPYAGTPLGEIMALDFAKKELNLYLDTHKDDKEAFEMLKSIISLSKEAKKRYVKLYGPLQIDDLEYSDEYNWTNDPWPWEFCENSGR